MSGLVRRWPVLVPALFVFVFCVGVASAQTDEEVTDTSPYQIRPLSLVVMIAVGAAIPLLTALLTKYNAPAALKGGLTILMTALTALFTQAQVNDGVAILSKQSLILWFFGLVAAESAYYAGWKPFQVPPNLAPRFGLGPAAPPRAP